MLNIIGQQENIRTAFLGFVDRFRAVPGDYLAATLNIPGVTGCGGNGNGDGRIEDASAGLPNNESVLAWEHLSKSGFLAGSYTCDATESSDTTPTNPFGSRLRLAWDNRYAGTGSPPARHALKDVTTRPATTSGIP